MGGKPVGIVLLLLACVGCHACQNCCDYLPPVAEGPFMMPGQRAGSAFGRTVNDGPSHEGPLHDTELSESKITDEQPPAEDSNSAGINLTLQELLAVDD